NSMAKAMGETERRREKQHQHNLKLGIVPRGVVKSITDVMDVGDTNFSKGTLGSPTSITSVILLTTPRGTIPSLRLC
ncbi:MAG TPA: hypothetical protein DDW91_02035, partial [Shewanella frigidimarina]|nr:hypothetical protein [Shewanella frigidimarina]